jgi:hypothetical protein
MSARAATTGVTPLRRRKRDRLIAAGFDNRLGCVRFAVLGYRRFNYQHAFAIGADKVAVLAVTGPKKERSLVRVVGALAVANGVALAVGAHGGAALIGIACARHPEWGRVRDGGRRVRRHGPDSSGVPRRRRDRGGARHHTLLLMEAEADSRDR